MGSAIRGLAWEELASNSACTDDDESFPRPWSMNQNASPGIFRHQVAYQKIEAVHLMGVHLHVVPDLSFWCPLSWLSMTGLEFPKVSSFADHGGASHCLSLHVLLIFFGPCSVE